MRILVLCLGCAATGCTAPPDAPQGPASETRDGAPEAPATPGPDDPFTALLAVKLKSSGEVEVNAISVKSIPWSATSAPFDPETHAPPADRVGWAPKLSESPEDRDPLDSPLAGGGSTQAPAAIEEGHAHRGALVVDHRSRALPFVVPLAWGQPGEGHGDVLDRWREGSVVWRAPWFGPDTEYRVVRVHPGPPALLARGRR